MRNQLALIGFGEAGAAFAASSKWRGEACAFDIDPRRHLAMREAGVLVAADAKSALADAKIVLSLVTASQAVAVARDYAPFIQPNALWCDMNSIAPHSKSAAGKIVEQFGGRYIDVAVLAPVHPALLNVPLLLSGPASEDARVELLTWHFTNVRVVGHEVGRASAIKMIRSVMVKGIEALTDEMMAAAEAAGVTQEVLASLDASERSEPWSIKAAYNLERMKTHGLRRAAEMREAAQALLDLGVEPIMTESTIQRQREAAGQNISKSGAT